MSARSIARAHQRRIRRRAKRSAAGAVAAVGAAAAFAPAADAATFEVTNRNDDGAGSLREAVDQANLAAGADTVTFAAGLTGTIPLTTGEIPIDETIDIQGPGASEITVSGDDNSRIFYADTDEATGAARDAVSISGLTLADGDESDGGAIYSDESDLRLTGMVLKNNAASSNGGAIDVESSVVTITDSRLTGNYAGSNAGAMYTDGDSDDDPGDTVTITNSVIRNNYSGSDAGAFYFDNATGGDILIAGSEISDNSAGGQSGGIEFYGHQGSSTVRNSTISGNSADGTGGGIYYDSAYDDADGLLVENSTISGNFANSAGGGVYVDNDDGEPIRIIASTIADNNADGDGGGIYRNDYAVNLTSTIVADNGAQGSDQDDLGEAGTATEQFILDHSLAERFDLGVTFIESPAGSNLLFVDPRLGPLDDNGGATETHLPADNSPVVDAGVASGLTTDQRGLPRTVDRSAVANRAGSDGTDMGSVELPDVELVGADASAKKKQKQGKKIKVKFSAQAGEQVDIEAAGKVKAGKKSYPLKPDTIEDVPDDAVAKGTLKPKSKKASKKIAKLLAGGKKAKATIEVGFTDAAGNAATDTVKVTLVGKKPKKK